MAGLLSARLNSSFAITRQLKKYSGINISTHCFRKLSFFKRKKSDTAISVEPIKSDYEVEYEKVVKEEKWHEEFGFFPEDPYLDKATANMFCFFGFSVTLVFLPMILYFAPEHSGRMTEWKRYEAVKLIEEREARGELPINIDFVPAELLESMVPPSGDWEEEWLRAQPSILPKDFPDSALKKAPSKN